MRLKQFQSALDDVKQLSSILDWTLLGGVIANRCVRLEVLKCTTSAASSLCIAGSSGTTGGTEAARRAGVGELKLHLNVNMCCVVCGQKFPRIPKVEDNYKGGGA